MGGRVPSHPEKIVLRYAYGMEKSLLDIHLNTKHDLVFTPHGYLSQYKQKIMSEINPRIKKNFATSAKIWFFFSMKIQKLNEDGIYIYDVSEIKTKPFHINPQTDNVTENIMNSAIDDLHEKIHAKTYEGNGLLQVLLQVTRLANLLEDVVLVLGLNYLTVCMVII